MALGYLLIRSVPLVRMYETDIIYQFPPSADAIFELFSIAGIRDGK